jgi:rRNA large subunit m3Psi methyltransferase RlmH
LAALGIPTKSKTPAPKLTSPKPKPKLSAQKPKTTTYTIALDVRGNSLSTEQLAEKLKRWQMEFSTVNFLIGGPEGLSDICLNYADERLSLSELTFPHSLVRVMLIEQLYRAVSLLTGHPYHRA